MSLIIQFKAEDFGDFRAIFYMPRISVIAAINADFVYCGVVLCIDMKLLTHICLCFKCSSS